MELNYQYTKKRSNFGRQPLFCEQGPELCDSVTVELALHKQYILRNPVHQPTQHAPCMAEHEVNTIRVDYTTSGANHAEGGWPKDVNIADPEQTQRYRRKIEKDDNYVHCVMSCSPGLEHYVLQNNAIDMYKSYYTEMDRMPELERSSCRTVNVFRDKPAPARLVSSIAWQPDTGGHFAVTYVDVDYHRVPRKPTHCYIWDVENANSPNLKLEPPCAMLDLQYSPKEPSILAGGLIDGRVGAWDGRLGGNPFVTCPPHVAHRDLVRSVMFINSKSGQEFFSGGPDGVCKWWDLRNMSEPTDEMIMDAVKSSFESQTMPNANGICVMDYEPTLPTRFLVGTENGLVLNGNRKGKTPLEKIPMQYEAHSGPVYSLERNPFFLKNFLTVGDYRLRVWSEECRDSPILWMPPHRHKITAATWSPQRLSLVAGTQEDGRLLLWDLLRRQDAPLLTMQVCDEPLLNISVQEHGILVACGSRLGNVYMIELSQNLAESDKNDKSLFAAILDRETKRERILEARLREIRLKQKQAEEGSVHEETEPEGNWLQNTTQAYMAAVKKEQGNLF